MEQDHSKDDDLIIFDKNVISIYIIRELLMKSPFFIIRRGKNGKSEQKCYR